jgi:ABC-type multidrug transport system fused ATPase/permease subunit
MDRTCRNLGLCTGSRCLFGECAIWRKGSRRRIVGRHRWNAKCVDRISCARPADRRRQHTVADRKFDREFLLRRRHWRPAARSVLPPYESCTELLRGPIARYAREPRHGAIQCHLYVGEYVCLEHIAAMRRDGRGDCVRGSNQRAHIDHVGGRGGRYDRSDVPHSGGGITSVIVVLTAGLLAWAIFLWQRGEATTGDVVLVCTLGLSVLHATRDLAVGLVDVTQHVARLSEALSTLPAPHQLCDHPEAVSLVKRGASIAFENISFCFPNGQPVFENPNLSLEPGQRTGLVGPSGAGKSTLFALLQRHYDVRGGRILVDGQDISRVTQHSLRETIAVVPQDLSLFHRSAMENIRYGRPDASDDEVFEAAIAARCYDFVEALPDGFKTIVGERGMKLSGGQRQRIAIARAFLKGAPLLLLDEATSALDTESEDEIQIALGSLMRGRTVVAIAHRLSTLRNFDRIVVLQAGRSMEDGSPDHLVQRDGIYRTFVKREMSHFAQRAA